MATNLDAQDLGTLIGRILMSALFIWSGYEKLMSATATQAYFTSLGVPFPTLAWLIAVIIELGVGLALLVGFQTRVAALVLGIWCIITAVAGHSNFADPEMQINFMKNAAMAGGFAYIALFGAGAYSLDRIASPHRATPARS